MNRKLNECNNCPYWDNKENKMKNRLRCITNCDTRIKHQLKMAIIFNRSMGSKQNEYEHGKEVL